MKGRIGILSVLLAVQLAIAAALIFVRAGAAGESPDRLLALDGATVDRVVLTDGESGEVTLERGETGWTTADGLPADDTKVSELIETFGSMDAPWPVASTQGARERFEVDDDRFQRRVRFYQGRRGRRRGLPGNVARLPPGARARSRLGRRLRNRIRRSPGADQSGRLDGRCVVSDRWGRLGCRPSRGMDVGTRQC